MVQPLPNVPVDMLNLPTIVPDLLVQERGPYGVQQAAFEPNDLRPYLQEVSDPILRNLLCVLAEEDQKAE